MFGRTSASKSYRPKRDTPVGQKGLRMKSHIDATLGAGNVLEAINCPPGEDYAEWLAVNTVDFYNAISVLYATLEEYCTPDTCSIMSAGPKYEYLWADGVKVKRPIKLSAPEYIEHLFDWIEDLMDNPAIFPQKMDQPFPAEFPSHTKTMVKRLFRVYGHIYHHHFAQVEALKETKHLNTCFKHFIFFCMNFQLLEQKEITPMLEIIEQFCRTADYRPKGYVFPNL